MLNQFNEFLGNYVNIISVIASFASIVALIISIIAFMESNKQAKLILKYRRNNENNMAGDYYEDGNGYIRLNSSIVDDKSDIYAKINSDNLVDFVIENKSTIVAKSPILSLKFINMEVDIGENNNFEQINKELRWHPKDNTTIHKGINFRIEQFNFKNCFVLKKEAYIEVVLSADNMETKEFRIPIKVY
ncbi:hypothetical protein [Clostridioides sp. ZZV15-6598]|uniref:hypothetical protein n=1 Tax=Clostridioides sp. ZZV15-6598 TaxID=2811501 RepID=UPI001D118BFE|nr:hypothetical protein [Clostridioides sp. ZZV15-6598]